MTAFQHNKVLWVVGSVASIMTAFYMFRLLYLTFYKDFRGTEEQKNHLHESPSLITFPLIVLAVLALVGGVISIPGNSWLNEYLSPILTKHIEHHAFGTTEYMLMGVAIIGAFIGIGIAYFKYIKQGFVPGKDEEITGFSKVLYNKFYVDEIYTAIIVKPVYALGAFFKNVTEVAFSGFIFGLGRLANALSTQGKVIQNGSIGFYLLVFVLGICSIIAYIFLK